MGHERNEFKESFSKYQIVTYEGHSRYGQGPAFESTSKTGIFPPVGNNFPAIEVDTRNPYFPNEPIQLTNQFPVQNVTLDNVSYPFQYRGPKRHESYLDASSYTKNIPGKDIDWVNTQVLPGKQIYWIHSCSNNAYFKEPIRDRFPSVDEKFVFGTNVEVYMNLRSTAAFIMQVVLQVQDTKAVLAELLKAEECATCITTF